MRDATSKQHHYHARAVSATLTEPARNDFRQPGHGSMLVSLGCVQNPEGVEDGVQLARAGDILSQHDDEDPGAKKDALNMFASPSCFRTRRRKALEEGTDT